MRKFFAVAVLLSAGTTSAQTTQQWTPGWDNLTEPLNFTESSVTWSVPSGSTNLVVTYKLVGATPTQLYQVGVHIFCTTFPATLGQFPTHTINGVCQPLTAQSVTASVAWLELGLVLTDIHGDGFKGIVVGPITPGTYNVEFNVRNGAGCDVTGGGGNSECTVDFQSPGPTFGTTTTITVP
jgi:hypothetical protein